MDSYPEYGYTYPSNVGIPYPYPPAVMDTVSVSTRRLGYIVDTRIQEEDGLLLLSGAWCHQPLEWMS